MSLIFQCCSYLYYHGVVCAVNSNSEEAMEKKLRLSFVWKKIIIIVQTSRYLQPDVKKIGFEV